MTQAFELLIHPIGFPTRKVKKDWNLLAIVEDGICDFDSETSCPVEAIPGCIGGRTGISLKCDVGTADRFMEAVRAWLWSGT